MLKINSKKKVNKPANTLKPQFAQKKPLVQPEWNATNSDLDRYRLSKAEQVQKKVSLISKHRYEAKELWLQRQEKLKRGIVDEETQTVLETCLSTKRPPEKNMKNLTYFIKDDTYADYLDQAYEESEEKRLSVMDLHPQEKSEIKEIKETKPVKTREEKPKAEKKQDLDEGDDFIRKVNESLKDARDFMTKIERYPSITKAKDPERALKTLATAGDKENNSRSSSNHAKKKPAAVTTSSSTNLKSSLGSSQNGKRTSNLNSSSGFKETSPQLPKVEETYKPKYVEEPPKEVYAAEEKDNKEDISTYFKSLNQIEDTIKFLEENIIGGGSAAPEKKEYNYELPSMPKANERFGFGFGLDDYKSPAVAENKYRGDDSLEKSAEKEEDSYFKKREEDSYFKKRGASPSHSDIKHHHDHEEELSRDHTDHHEHHDDHDEHDDEQISFALTMKSNDHTERNLDHDHHDDYKPGYASKLFGFDDMISPVATTLQKPFPIALHSPPEYPQTIFENKAIQERTRTQNIKPQSPPKMEVRPQAQHHEEEEEEEDEEEFNIERIKGLLQATKLEIEKMNTDKMESYNNSYKTALEDMDKENVSNNRGGFGTTTYNKFDNPVMGKKIEVVKNDAFVTVKQPFNALWENQRKVLADTRDMYDDDIPAPQTLDIKKQAVAATYSPKKFDDMPLNFRSFRK